MTLDSKIESILFFKGEPVKKKWLAETLSCSIAEVDTALETLEEKLQDRGLTLIFEKESVLMGTAKEASPLIEKITKEELHRDLGKAGLETLSIIVYKNPASKSEIDYIRGVNSAFIIRNLMIRGLIERLEIKGKRGYSYAPTTEFLSFMGMSKAEELPEFDAVRKELEDFAKKEENTDTNTDGTQ